MRERALLPGVGTLLVACSGGPDSQALLHVLAALREELGCQLLAASVDHGLRPDAQRDVTTAARLADALGVRFHLLRELLRTSDVVSLHVPLNASTRHMIGADELALMKPLAILVNTARGPVVDEAALTRALSAGKLFGAGLDVFDSEPPAAGNPLLELENVVLTAHFAGPTWDNHVARFRNAFDNIQRVERGEPPLWVVPELSS